jgi:hypothetical protein
MNAFAKFTGVVVIAVGGILAITLLRGLVLVSLWGWFVVPLGVPGIGIAHAIGISILASLFLFGLATDKSSEEQEGWVKVIHAFVKALAGSLFAWGMGAIVHGFM